MRKTRSAKIKFYIDTSIIGYEILHQIIEDYFYWFNVADETELVLFTSTEHPEFLLNLLNENKKIDRPRYLYLRERIKPEDLYKFYTKKLLLNEWIHYKKHDIFRLYKLFSPISSDINFDNQAISIQYDIRYHKNRKDIYGSYKKEHLSAVESAINYYKPENVLDMGCGAGAQYFLLKDVLKKHHTKYHGIDISRFQIIKAIDLFESDMASFSIGNAMNLDFENQFAGISFSESTLPFLPDPLKALKELNRISRNGFFAALYTIRKRQPFLEKFKRNNIYALDTGATWKYYDKITPNIYYLPEYQALMRLAESFKNVIVVEENSDQFFEPLDVTTSNLFFYPKKWYRETKNKHLNLRPLM